MIRYAYICNQILQIYRNLDGLSFPLDPRKPFQLMDNCKLMTYKTFSEINRCSLQEVFLLCESQSGCTHYDVSKTDTLFCLIPPLRIIMYWAEFVGLWHTNLVM